MLLGKRPRHNIKRTASFSEIAFDLNAGALNGDVARTNIFAQNHVLVSYGGQIDQPYSRPSRRASADFLETPHFLRSCSLCKRKLVAGRDIYMYRGDSAYCSHECREQQMNLDERKEKKCGMASKKEVSSSSSGRTNVLAKETAAAMYA